MSDPGPPPSPAADTKVEAKGKGKGKGKGRDKEKAKESDKASRNEAVAVGACPRCTQQLVSERYAVSAEVDSSRVEGRTSLIAGQTGAELLRCEDCMGAFVSRSSAEVLSWLSASDDAPPSQSAAKLPPLPWERFVTLLKGFLGIKE